MMTLKIIIVIMLVSLFQVNAGVKAQTVSLNKKMSLKAAFKSLKKQTGYDFIYMASDASAFVSVEADRIPLNEALRSFLRPLSLDFEIQEKTVLIKKKTNTFHPETGKEKRAQVTGKVTDGSTKQPIPGANVVVKGTKITARTDVNGYFTIQVPYADAVIIVTYLGYQPQQIELNGKSTIEVFLVEDAKALEEVTVVGYTTQRKESVTGAVSTITTKDLLQSPSANINNVLAGRLPGLIANQYSGGEPGVDKSEIFIRGKSTYGDQSPIIIVDGVERDMSYLSAEEIETFTILKDAAATAPYGIRGANGVIVIKTKRGQASERATLNFRMSQGINTPTKLPKMLGSADYAMLNNEAKINDAVRDGLSPADIAKLNLFTPEAIDKFRRAKGDNSDGLGYNHDYFKYIFGRGLQQEYNLSIRGGNDKARYYILGGYFGQGPNYKHVDLSNYGVSSKFKRYNFRSNIDVDITDKLSARLDLGARITDRTAPATTASRLATLATTQPPYLPITVAPNANKANSAYLLDNPGGMLFGDQIYRYNVLGELTRSGYLSQKITNLNGTFSLRYNLDLITSGLSIDGSLSYDATSDQWINRRVDHYTEGYREYPGYATFVPTGGSDVYMSPGFYDGAYKTGNKYSIDQTLGNKFEKHDPSNRTYYQLKLNYERTFNKVHEVAGMLLFNRSGQGAYNGDKAGVDYRYQGMTGQFNYNLNRKYLASFNFGYNGSENFAKDKRYGFFPAGSVGWVISKEDFMKGTASWLDQLKIRGSYGLVGSDRLTDNKRFAYLQTYGGGSGYDFGIQNFNVNPGGISEGTLANVNLTWEKARKTNIGLDATFLKQRLNVTVDYFHEYRYDILTSLSGNDRLGFPAVTGTSTPFINSGIVTNRGLEFEVSWSDQIGKDFRYTLKPNFTFARNKIVFQNEVPRENPWRQGTGHRLYENFVYVFDHFVADQAEADRLNKSQFQPWGKVGPGDVVYKDLNGDGKIDDLGDRMIVGNPRSPEIQFGLPISLQYKGFDFSVLLQGALNTSVMLRDAATWDFPQFDQDKTGSVKPMHLNRWTPETAATATYPALHIGQNSNNKNPNNSLFLYDAKYLRMKNMEVGYTLPKSLMRKVGLANVRIYAQGQNLFTWDGLDRADVDPEIGDAGGYWYPVLKVYNFGIDITL
ncbi:TonB-dependent receptor [Pedobacter sp. FW305-3-2-15-E-R2A2]|uniref:SusC/RagA family TonB-linked outer membrane protein n=1 Tax=Pedobacter sp. FW305-3-2-15-E-R2A2 TaxID=3140251 RepID=UPI00314055D0